MKLNSHLNLHLKSLLLVLIALFVTACASNPAMNYKQSDGSSLGQYKTFSIKTLDIKGHNSRAEQVVHIALKDSLEKRGLTYSENNADLNVHYAIGIKSTQAVDLKPVSIGSGVYTSHNVVANTRATLVINIQDTKTNENIWRVSGSQTVRTGKIPQADVNAEFSEILQNFQ